MNFFSNAFLNTLTWYQWLAIGLVPPAIISLYFLKLKRLPLEVPSTYLWSRTIEDLHVNSIWQRLRQSILLLLQLLLLALLILSLVRPGWSSKELTGDRFIFLIDTTASMSATDVKPSRLDAAKEQISSIIKRMKSGDVAMLLSVSNSARVEQPFTDNRGLLQSKLNAIEPTNRDGNMDEALRYASGLANPGRSAEDDSDVQVADAMPATLFIFSDGGFKTTPNFFLGNLTPKYYPIGAESPDNVAVGAFSIERNTEKLDQTQAFARLENYGVDDVEVTVSLKVDGDLKDADSMTVPAGGQASVQFSLDDVTESELELSIDRKDQLNLDNKAYIAANLPRRAKVLLVTPTNEALSFALGTDEAQKFALVEKTGPAVLSKDEYLLRADAGAYDLIIYDRCSPKEMPQSNTIFIGSLPPGKGWTAGEKQGPPLIIDSNRIHPLMQLLDMGNVNIVEGFVVKPPSGGASLLDADIGSIAAIAPRQGFEDVVFGFDIYSTSEGNTVLNTDWHIRRSFPIFVMNAVRYLGGARTGLASLTVKPGETATIRPRGKQIEEVEVIDPDGSRTKLSREGDSAFVYTFTDKLGVYDVREGNATEVAQKFTVNLFDNRESNILPEQELQFGPTTVGQEVGSTPKRRELWKWILMLGLVVLVFEWYVYNRRVYL